LVGRLGPRRPLLLAGAFTAAGGLCLADLGQDTDIRLLLTAQLLLGIGFGFANTPLTNAAVGGLPASRAGVAGAITSTARQVGSAVGVALSGALIAGAGPDGLARAARPGWLLVAACGLFLMGVARAAAPVRRKA
ncbi:MFS transporter, partial [Streptomyces sp. SID2131]|nr:MFS transporter [Streptomyces sp. SID2131]